MSFVAPGLLFGMALLAVPVVLHLIMRQRPRQVPFPPLRFLQVRREANQRRLRLRHLLLLLLALRRDCPARLGTGPADDSWFGLAGGR